MDLGTVQVRIESEALADHSMVPYTGVDLLYGWPSLDPSNGFTSAQAVLNLFEAGLNIICVALGDHPAAPVIGLITATMTAAKTILYFVQGELCWLCSS